MTVAVIGTGFIGGTLGRAFARAGLPTVFGSRTPDTETAAQDSGATTAPVADAVAKADTVVLAVPATAVEDLLITHGAQLAGKLVVDAANNIGGPVAHHADLVARHAPKARYARAFNTLGGENLADPGFGGARADMFYSAPETTVPTWTRSSKRWACGRCISGRTNRTWSTGCCACGSPSPSGKVMGGTSRSTPSPDRRSAGSRRRPEDPPALRAHGRWGFGVRCLAVFCFAVYCLGVGATGWS
ncbi:NADPH-dependent F420 reductase [Streptacidiphilus neutrinimicus]|uniref:NADPH-dependent F420 reductase n=1 Tax=Streptacidiphilus neutrinimicus TaxID=105420 RepID=UPI000693B54B|nr:NAD(P)-binding domain-containing protein [Streptacidiphilus neutrinimicus]